MDSKTIEAISSVDLFHKNCLLLFQDVVSTIREKTITSEVSNLVGPEGHYQVWNINESLYQRQYVFQHDKQIRFVCMFIKIQENKLPNSLGFKQICRDELHIDPIYPFIIVFGLFQPRDVKRFSEQLNVRRNWIENTILLSVPEDIIKKKVTRSDPYKFGELLEIETTDDTDSWYCEKSLFIIKKLVDVKDSEAIGSLVDELIKINA